MFVCALDVASAQKNKGIDNWALPITCLYVLLVGLAKMLNAVRSELFARVYFRLAQ